MVLVCFVLDLCGLSPTLLRDVKQCLLQLANFYAISTPSRHRSDSLRDRIGLCYVFKNRISSSLELKVAYSPGENFSLRDFHHAVNNLPVEAFLPELNDSGIFCSHDMKLSSVLSDRVLYLWGGKDIMRKVIVLSSFLPDNIDSVTKETLMDAADKCVSVEFLLFEHSSSHLSNMRENLSCFARSLSDLENCSFQTYLSDGRVFQSLIKRWLQDLKDDMEEPLLAHFHFNENLFNSVNRISCTLSISAGPIVDGFSACQTCRCHGNLLGNAVKDKTEEPSCPITGRHLEKSDVIDFSVKVGDTTILYMPSFEGSVEVQQASSPIDFNIIERANLNSLSEGVLIGTSYFVAPSAFQEVETSSDQMDQSELNCQLFLGIRRALYTMDQGLICSSLCNVETMKMVPFRCYYLLQPSNRGPMLLRRLAGAEEVFPMPDATQFSDSSLPADIQNSIEATLLKMELRDYDPLLHERGFHQKLNSLVGESLQYGSIPRELNEPASVPTAKEPHFSEVIAQPKWVVDAIEVEEETLQLKESAKEDTTAASIAEEWEQLVVNEVPMLNSPTCISKPRIDQFILISPDSNKQLDVKTSKILERLEAPKQLKPKLASPVVTSSNISDTCVQTKKPLIPFQSTQATGQSSTTSSLLMKPNFQRPKRKYK